MSVLLTLSISMQVLDTTVSKHASPAAPAHLVWAVMISFPVVLQQSTIHATIQDREFTHAKRVTEVQNLLKNLPEVGCQCCCLSSWSLCLLPLGLLVCWYPISCSPGCLSTGLLVCWFSVSWSPSLAVLVSQFGSLGLPVWSVSFDCAMVIGLSLDLRKRF